MWQQHEHRQQQQQNQQSVCHPATRRCLLAAVAAAAAVAIAPSPPAAAAGNEAVVRGLDKYVKKKQLDPLDTYVPLLLEARDQLIRTGRVMCERSGPTAAGTAICVAGWRCTRRPAVHR